MSNELYKETLRAMIRQDLNEFRSVLEGIRFSSEYGAKIQMFSDPYETQKIYEIMRGYLVGINI